MSFLPLFHNSQRLHALIIGGGRVALRRAKALVKAEVTCDLIAPDFSPELAELIRQSGGQIQQQHFAANSIQTH